MKLSAQAVILFTLALLALPHTSPAQTLMCSSNPDYFTIPVLENWGEPLLFRHLNQSREINRSNHHKKKPDEMVIDKRRKHHEN